MARTGKRFITFPGLCPNEGKKKKKKKIFHLFQAAVTALSGMRQFKVEEVKNPSENFPNNVYNHLNEKNYENFKRMQMNDINNINNINNNNSKVGSNPFLAGQPLEVFPNYWERLNENSIVPEKSAEISNVQEPIEDTKKNWGKWAEEEEDS